jgi:TPR repeat protein
MSSLIQDDADKQLTNALPWVSDPRRQEEARRLEEEVIEATRSLEREASALTPQTPAQPSQPRTEIQLAEARSIGEKYDPDELSARFWAALKPELMPPPPREQLSLPDLGLAAGLVGAISVAAVIALVVANLVQIPTINAGAAGEDEAGRSQSFSTATLRNLTRIAAAQANMQPADEPSVAPGTLLAAVPTIEIAEPKFPAPLPPPPSEAARARPEIATPATAAAPEPRTAVSLTRDEITSMRKRGRDLIAAGDVASGRLMLTHLAEAGDAEASFILAGTFDAAVLATMRVVGVQPDPAKARAWYARAAEQGSSEARQRLQQSALR